MILLIIIFGSLSYLLTGYLGSILFMAKELYAWDSRDALEVKRNKSQYSPDMSPYVWVFWWTLCWGVLGPLCLVVGIVAGICMGLAWTTKKIVQKISGGTKSLVEKVQ